MPTEAVLARQSVVYAHPPRAYQREWAIAHGEGAMGKNNSLPPDHDLPADLQQSVKKTLKATDDLCPPPYYDAAYWRGERGALLDGLVYRRKHLPPKNSDFGLKKVLFEVDGTVDYAEVEVFYPAEGRNHPPDEEAKGTGR